MNKSEYRAGYADARNGNPRKYMAFNLFRNQYNIGYNAGLSYKENEDGYWPTMTNVREATEEDNTFDTSAFAVGYVLSSSEEPEEDKFVSGGAEKGFGGGGVTDDWGSDPEPEKEVTEEPDEPEEDSSSNDSDSSSNDD